MNACVPIPNQGQRSLQGQKTGSYYIPRRNAFVSDDDNLYPHQIIVRAFGLTSVYQFVHDARSLQKGFGRIVSKEKNWQYRSRSQIGVFIRHACVAPTNEADVNSHQFVPSDGLVENVQKCMVKYHDKQVNEIINELKGLTNTKSDGDVRKNLKIIISEQIEDMLTAWAKHYSAFDNEIEITYNTHFLPDIKKEIIERLGLEPGDSKLALDSIYNEMVEYCSVARRRAWGNFYLDQNSNIKLSINKKIFRVPNIMEIENDDKWVLE